ncbi:MAG: NAD(P)H-binding protein [Bacteroidetes bacterium]|nr:NAD(P)H-binding protein [Bacteroidota bacterium]
MKALIIGASGLIGSHLLSVLEQSYFFDEVEIWLRKPIPVLSSKIKIKIVDFENLNECIDAQYVYCCVGSTIKKAKTWETYYKIDYDIPVKIAHLCQQPEVKQYIVISSLGANKLSSNKYLKMKGEMEEVVLNNDIPCVIVLRPSLLLGNRDESRTGEKLGKFFMQLLGFLFVGKMKRYRGIEALTVANAMLHLAKENPCGKLIYESDAIQKMGS